MEDFSILRLFFSLRDDCGHNEFYGLLKRTFADVYGGINLKNGWVSEGNYGRMGFMNAEPAY